MRRCTIHLYRNYAIQGFRYRFGESLLPMRSSLSLESEVYQRPKYQRRSKKLSHLHLCLSIKGIMSEFLLRTTRLWPSSRVLLILQFQTSFRRLRREGHFSTKVVSTDLAFLKLIRRVSKLDQNSETRW